MGVDEAKRLDEPVSTYLCTIGPRGQQLRHGSSMPGVKQSTLLTAKQRASKHALCLARESKALESYASWHPSAKTAQKSLPRCHAAIVHLPLPSMLVNLSA